MGGARLFSWSSGGVALLEVGKVRRVLKKVWEWRRGKRTTLVVCSRLADVSDTNLTLEHTFT